MSRFETSVVLALLKSMKSLVAVTFSVLTFALLTNAGAQSRPQIDNGDLFMIMNYAAGIANSPQSFPDQVKTSCDCRVKDEPAIGKKATYSCNISSLQDRMQDNVSKYKAGQKLTLTLKAKPESSGWDWIEIDHLERDYIKDDVTGEPFRSRDLEHDDANVFDRIEALYGFRRIEIKSLTENSLTVIYDEGGFKDHLYSEGIDPANEISAKLTCTRVKNSETQAR